MTESNGNPFERNMPPRPHTPPAHPADAHGHSAHGHNAQGPDDGRTGNSTERSAQSDAGLPPAVTEQSNAYPQTQPQTVHPQSGQHNGDAFGPMPHGSPYGAYGTGQPPVYKRREKKRVGSGMFVSGMLVAGLIGGGVVAGSDALLDSRNGVLNTPNAQPQSVVVNDTESVNEVTGAAAKASPSVVTIGVNGGGAGGSGSGIILDEEGHILTNTHVVTLGGQAADAAVEVRTNDGRVFQAEIIGTDPLSDLAVIKIDAPDLQPATLADSAELNVGDAAIAIGSPLGLSGTVTDGIISTLNRTISVASSAVPEEQADEPQPQGQGGDGFNFLPPEGANPEANQQPRGSVYLNVIQTDAAINQGNSGGALVDSQGRVIGVNVAIASAGSNGGNSGNIGVGFSIPINYAQRVAEEIIETGEARHGFLGVSVQPAASENTGERTTFSVGAEVAEVVGSSPAANAGLEVGDVITTVAGIPINDPQALTASIRMQAVGQAVEVQYVRDGEALTTEVTLAESPE